MSVKTEKREYCIDLTASSAKPSGGTLASAIGLFETYHWKKIVKSHKPYALSPVANTKLPPPPSLFSKLTGLYSIPNLGLLTRSIASGTDAAIVMRTWGLTKQEPSLHGQFYGPNFTYREFRKAGNFLTGMFFHYTLSVVGVLMMFCSPFRSLLRRMVVEPGNGPSREKSANEYIEFRGVATADLQTGAGKQAVSKAWHTGSMYMRKSLVYDLYSARYIVLTNTMVTYSDSEISWPGRHHVSTG